jgi:hypothetical protein
MRAGSNRPSFCYNSRTFWVGFVSLSLSESGTVMVIALAELLIAVLPQAVRSRLGNTKPSEEPWATIPG